MTQGLHVTTAQNIRGIQPIIDRPSTTATVEKRSLLGLKLKNNEPVISVEIVPPRGIDVDKFLSLCRQLETAGIDFVNIPDGARAGVANEFDATRDLHSAQFKT